MTSDSGNIYASSLVYSDNFINQVEADEWGQSRLMTGISPTTFKRKLTPNQNFSTLETVSFCSKQGLNGLMKQARSFVKKHITDQKWQQQDKLAVINNWEATYFDFNEEKPLRPATQANQLGIECSVLDDGWFGKQDSDNSSLGSWTMDKRKLPQGLDYFSAQVHKMGMRSGLWFEPEMVSVDTELYNIHPDWIVRRPYKHYPVRCRQYVFDFANPAVIDNIYQQMAKIVEDIQVDYIKWDINRNITETYPPYLCLINHPQGEILHRHTQGVCESYAKLLTSFPDLLTEGCASSGGRLDLGILYYSPQIWPSGDGGAAERLDVMSETLLVYPLSTFSNHISTVPNDQVKRVTSLKFRQNVVCFGPLGYELDLNELSTEERNQIKNRIRWYKENRRLSVNGTFDQLLKFDPLQNTYAWGVSSSSKQIVGSYRELVRSNEASDQYLPPKHLNDHQKYQINFDRTVSGRVL